MSKSEIDLNKIGTEQVYIGLEYDLYTAILIRGCGLALNTTLSLYGETFYKLLALFNPIFTHFLCLYMGIVSVYRDTYGG